MSYRLLRNALFCLPPEFAHRAALESLGLATRMGFSFGAQPLQRHQGVDCLGLTFPNRVGLAAGYDKNGDFVDALGTLGFGFIEIGTITPRPQPGNAKPRLFRIPHQLALINQMGSPNKGIEHAVSKIGQRSYSGILGVNIGKNADTPLEKAADDYLACYRAAASHADYVALNISSPNTKRLRELQDRQHLRHILIPLIKARDETERRVPILVKLSPDLSIHELHSIADTIAELGVDGVIATNTTTSRQGVAIGEARMESGGLSGAPLHQRSVDAINCLRSRLGEAVPIIGVGGIMN
ncbi:MAG: quinone-dependent dihydroorotate dehydrogenase, partial [Gammaproteobacteria bacterium]